MRYLICTITVLCALSTRAWSEPVSPTGADVSKIVIPIFQGNGIHFNPQQATMYDTLDVTARDNGRMISRTIVLPTAQELEAIFGKGTGVQVTARVIIQPIQKNEKRVWDPWDRAGNIILSGPEIPDIEVVKFITGFGGHTEFSVDVSDLWPLLQGERRFHAFIDTWLSPAWKVDFSLEYSPDFIQQNPINTISVIYQPDLKATTDIPTVRVTIPNEAQHVFLHYLISGHCTDGQDEDEFVAKDNVVYIDGIERYRYKPWRDDCRRFRDVNPFSGRWEEVWSSDLERSGWCPGDVVLPLKLDLSTYLTPGVHDLRLVVENIRPADDKGNYGYWRQSCYLTFWGKQ